MAKLTIKDIAQLCGVGKSTVSRVLNRDRGVSAQTRRRVEAVIAEQGFQPSRSARAMRGIAGCTIGIIVSRLSSASENQALASMLPLLYAQHCEPVIVESRFNPGLVYEHLDFFSRRNVDGVILFAFSGLDETQLRDWRHNMVVIARQYGDFSSVYYDDERAITLLMAHLYAGGHRSIGYLGVSDDDVTTGFNRHQAYRRFCLQHRLTPRSIQGSLDYHWAYRHVSAVISDDVSALVCATDNLAIGAVKYLQEQGLSHIQVCGVGNNPLLRFLFPSVVSIDPGFSCAGELAVKQLFTLLESSSVQHFCLPCRLIVA